MKNNVGMHIDTLVQKEINKEFIKDVEVLELIGLADDPLTSTRSGITNGIKVALAADEERGPVSRPRNAAFRR